MRAISRRSQSGQSIVMVGLIIVVLFGFIGLSMDGGRGYLDRRSLQASVDAAALGAAYNYMNTSDPGAAEQAAVNVYSLNQRLYVPPTCSGIGTLSVDCTYSDPTGQELTLTVVNRSFAGMTFQATAKHRIGVTVMQVLGVGSTIPVGATATALARRAGSFGAAIQTLSPGTCNGGTTSLAFTGTSTTQVTGDIWSDGVITDIGTAGGSVTGNVSAVCPNMPPQPLASPQWTISGAEGNGFNMPDPDYPMPPLNSTAQTWNSTNGSTESPGTYVADPKVTGASSPCYFLAGGVYDFAAGFTQNSGLISNELRPPDEPNMASAGVPNTTTTTAAYNDAATLSVAALPGAIPAGSILDVGLGTQTLTASKAAAAGDLSITVSKVAVAIPSGQLVTIRSASQFWDANSSCGSSFYLSSPGSGGSLSSGAYSVEVTAVRWAPNGVASCTGPASPTCYERESAPSMCKTISVNSSGNLKVDVTPDPGAQDYNVYVAPNGNCTGLTFCTDTGNGSSSQTITSCPASAVTPPDEEGVPLAPGLPNANPTPAAPPHGDMANERHCVDSTTGGATTCPGSWTPGAVVLFIPGPGSNQQCLNLQGGGDIYMFSGYQYQRVLIYEPGPEQTPPPNTCPNNIAGHGLTSLIGILYTPAANDTIIGNHSYLATIAGGVITWTASVQGNGGVSISADPSLRALPSEVRLIQ